MNVAVLLSGGKDSQYALFKASAFHTVTCLITMKSLNAESYMFQTPGVDFVQLQAQALELPLIEYDTGGVKEDELDDLKKAIFKAQQEYGVEGVVTGAIRSAYQSLRIQRICHELDLWCFNPLWQIDESEYVKALIQEGFDVRLIGVSAYPLTEKHLGMKIDDAFLSEFSQLHDKFQLSVAGEGGEFESFVVDSPLFKKRIEFVDVLKRMDSENSGVLVINDARLVEK